MSRPFSSFPNQVVFVRVLPNGSDYSQLPAAYATLVAELQKNNPGCKVGIAASTNMGHHNTWDTSFPLASQARYNTAGGGQMNTISALAQNGTNAAFVSIPSVGFDTRTQNIAPLSAQMGPSFDPLNHAKNFLAQSGNNILIVPVEDLNNVGASYMPAGAIAQSNFPDEVNMPYVQQTRGEFNNARSSAITCSIDLNQRNPLSHITYPQYQQLPPAQETQQPVQYQQPQQPVQYQQPVQPVQYQQPVQPLAQRGSNLPLFVLNMNPKQQPAQYQPQQYIEQLRAHQERQIQQLMLQQQYQQQQYQQQQYQQQPYQQQHQYLQPQPYQQQQLAQIQQQQNPASNHRAQMLRKPVMSDADLLRYLRTEDEGLQKIEPNTHPRYGKPDDCVLVFQTLESAQEAAQTLFEMDPNMFSKLGSNPPQPKDVSHYFRTQGQGGQMILTREQVNALKEYADSLPQNSSHAPRR